MPDCISSEFVFGDGNGERFLFKVRSDASEIIIPATDKTKPIHCTKDGIVKSILETRKI